MDQEEEDVGISGCINCEAAFLTKSGRRGQARGVGV